MRSLVVLALLVGSASAQDFNIDVGDNLAGFGVPDDSYAGAAYQPGHWNAVVSPYSTTLVNLDGTPSTVTVSSSQPLSFNYPASTLSGDDRNLMVDAQLLPGQSGPWTWTFSGFGDGTYEITTYAWSPDNSGAQTLVTVPGAIDVPQLVGGTWNGG